MLLESYLHEDSSDYIAFGRLIIIGSECPSCFASILSQDFRTSNSKKNLAAIDLGQPTQSASNEIDPDYQKEIIHSETFVMTS